MLGSEDRDQASAALMRRFWSGVEPRPAATYGRGREAQVIDLRTWPGSRRDVTRL
jgi:hypothetical protein